MKLHWPIVCVILISGCETAPPTINYTFQEFKSIEAEATEPLPLPDLVPLECYPSEEECNVVGYKSPENVAKLEIYTTAAKSNTAIAEGNATIINTLIARDAELISAGQAQETITALRMEQLAWERQERIRDRWFYRIALTLVTIAAIDAASD